MVLGKIINRKDHDMEKIRIGVFGGRRGGNFVHLMKDFDEIEIIAICDWDIDRLECRKAVPGAKFFKEFDEFLQWGKENGMNAMFLANYFHQHAPYAIMAMEAGMNVVSECTSAGTLKECVELVECVERTGRKYMIAENYPFMVENQQIAQMYRSGQIGRAMYAEGEYNHGGRGESVFCDGQNEWHWRAWLARTYYNTHAMGPLMYMTNSMPKYVSARAAHSDYLYSYKKFRHNYDGVAYMFCEMDNGMIARFSGCTAAPSDYSRYRLIGDIASVEWGNYTPGMKVRMVWHDYTLPEGQTETVKYLPVEMPDLGEKGEKAKNAGHGGGDFWIVQNMVDYFVKDEVPFFDVYKGVAMSATAILGWRSCLNHGENYRIPDFRSLKDRNEVRDDDLTPFPGLNGEPNTIPASVPFLD